jgi:hypothetical protein
MIKKKTIEFLKTGIGKKTFRKISESKNKQMFYDRLKSFLNPPKNVRRWVSMNNKLEEKIGDEENKLISD